MPQIAFIDLGRMGHGMAGRYLECGFRVAVWNRSKSKAEDLIARGVRWAQSPADAAEGAYAIVTMVADDEASRAVWVGKGTVYKLINNLMGAIQIAGIAEGLAIAEHAGLDMKLVLEAIETGVAASPQVIRHSKRMVARNFAGANFTAALRHKDAAYAVALAENLLSDVPVMGRAAVEAYARAKALAPDDDEGKMIEIVSRPKGTTR